MLELIFYLAAIVIILTVLFYSCRSRIYFPSCMGMRKAKCNRDGGGTLR